MVTPSPFPSSAVARALGFGALDFTNPSGARALREGYARCVASEGYVGNPEAAQGARDAAERFVAGVLPVIESIKQASVVSAQGIRRRTQCMAGADGPRRQVECGQCDQCNEETV